MAFDFDTAPYDDKVAVTAATSDVWPYKGRAADFNWIKNALIKLKAFANGTAGTIAVAAIPDLSATYTTKAREGVASGVATLDAGAKVPAAQIPPQPVLAAAFTVGKPAAGATMLAYLPTVAMTIPANLAGTRAKVGTNPTGAQVLSIKKNGTQVATISISTGGVVTLSTQAAISLVVTDELTVTAPASQDATMADVRFTIACTTP